ncbi:copper-binding protein [Polynucleobacter paneuropaeus]|jgi:Cu/Ag efflux protein CusF|nr:copper-binding protein [Polynucleobacter paneuropaeus]
MKKCVFGVLFLITSLSWAAPDWTKAQVVKVEPERHRIALKHERIQSIDMDAMTMLFDTAPKLNLKSYKAGDQVRFQVKISDGALEVVALEKAP